MLEKIGSWIKDAICWVFEHIIEIVTDLLNAVINTIVQAVPNMEIDTVDVEPYVAIVNAWAPVDLGLTLFAAYLAIEGAILVYRTIKKHIPTES